MSTSILGDITLTDKTKTSELTSAQIYSQPDSDSRIYPNAYYLTPNIIRELKKDPTVQLARWAVLAPMIHTPWTYVNKRVGGKYSATKEMIDFLTENLAPLRDMFLMQAVFGALDFGWQPFEVVYKPDNGQVYIDNYKALLQDYTTILVYINNGRFAGFTNESFGLNSSALIEEKYAQIVNFEIEGTDWYGYSVFQTLNKIQYSWNSVEDTANRYDRKIAGSCWVVYYPVGRTTFRGVPTANDLIAKAILNDLIASGGVVIPDEVQDSFDELVDKEAKGKWRIDLISADSTSAAGFIDRQKYLDALKFRAFGFPERSLQEGKHGTKEEADVHGDVALSIVDTRHRLITNQLNLYSIPHLMTMNFGKKYAYSVGVDPAPLVDNQFATVKEIYRMLLQNPETLVKEFPTINTKEMKSLLNIPNTGKEADTDFEEEEEPVAA